MNSWANNDNSSYHYCVTLWILKCRMEKAELTTKLSLQCKDQVQCPKRRRKRTKNIKELKHFTEQYKVHYFSSLTDQSNHSLNTHTDTALSLYFKHFLCLALMPNL